MSVQKVWLTADEGRVRIDLPYGIHNVQVIPISKDGTLDADGAMYSSRYVRNTVLQRGLISNRNIDSVQGKTGEMVCIDEQDDKFILCWCKAPESDEIFWYKVVID